MKWKLKREYEHIIGDGGLVRYVQGASSVAALMWWAKTPQGPSFWKKLWDREKLGEDIREYVLGTICERNDPEDCTWV